MLKGKKIVLGVTGSIAAYKAVCLLRELKKLGADVHVIMTKNAGKFVAPLTFQALSENRVLIDMFDGSDTGITHVDLTNDADLLVVAPSTANIIGKFASGIADDFLSTFFMAFSAPVLIAPAMNCNMYLNAIVRDNIKKLASFGYRFVGPATGELACKKEDIGRLSDIDDIIESMHDILTEKTLQGKSVLITAGPTVEQIDPVRFISNFSSGKMGYALAKVAKRYGATVTLISGPVKLKPPAGVNMIGVKSAHEMHDAVLEQFEYNDSLVMAAACADFTIESYSKDKIKKSDRKSLTLELKRTVDILAEISKVKGDRVVVGFAAETTEVNDNAVRKLRGKKLDFIVANDITDPNAGFEVDTNVATIIDSHEKAVHYEIMTKTELAEEIIKKIAALFTVS